MSTLTYEQLYENEIINIGDVISLDPLTEKVKLACCDKRGDDKLILGVCTEIENNNIIISTTGTCDVNVKGLICVGDKLTVGTEPGKAIAIKYTQDETQFDIRSIGKVIGLYQYYNVVKVLLDIE